ncbi:hypothetical protein [Pseudobacter ginsenosidimutans]|uniref:hypothetical protein n=1 Tax=Pseudobacter ginsenosidimutans TaxID=661488 RepID=UPI00102D7CAF|nr:hypothetical protein [Pseudobacter ginsenosidimutans]QEC40738.1 hypothetical protein FSB84_03150 [Pseudobacter ginsenosidimutans]
MFEHRNKEYGAYALRKAYNRQLIKGSVGMCLVVVLCMGGYYWWGGRDVLGRNKENVDDLITCSLTLIKLDTATEGETIKPGPAWGNSGYAVPVIAPDSIMDKDQAGAEDPPVPIFKDEIPGIIICPLPLEPPPEEFGTDAASLTDSVEHDLYFGPCIETLPQYPGGREAMLRFIDSALGFPGLVAEMDSVMEEMEKVIVLSQFRIEVDGQLSDIRFPVPVIEPYQTNVRRVLEAMPKWIPGKRNGKPFPMVVKLPIHFLLVEE